MATLDVERARRETPGCAEVAHLNNAGSALPPRAVLDAVVGHLELEARVGGYEAAEAAAERLEAVYDSVATLLNCAPHEIVVVENATRAWDMAFYALPWREGDRILTARAEYASNAIAFLHVAKRHGARVEVVPDDEHGQVSVEALERMLDERVRLVAITHVPTQGGLVNPATAIGEVTRRHGVLYLLDACQSVGQMPIDVQAIGCDMLSATGRKFLRGPRGTGFLYVRRGLVETLDPPFLDLHAANWTAPDRFAVRPDARRFENWEGYVAGKLGLGAAVDHALGFGLEAIRDRAWSLAEELRRRLSDLPGVTVHDQGWERCGIITFVKAGEPAAGVRDRLRAAGVNVSMSTAASARFDLDARGLAELVRASSHHYNTEEEIARLCRIVAERAR
jgi:cysteine desulfurase / selenocysteine lyase